MLTRICFAAPALFAVACLAADLPAPDRDAGQDQLGQRILNSGEEPSFANVSALLPAIKEPRDAVGAKDGRYEVGIEFDGTIQLDTGKDGWEQNGPTAWFEIGDKPVRFGAGGCKRRLIGGHLPIVACTFEHDGLRFEETVLGWSEQMKPETPLWACVRLVIGNPGETEKHTRIALKSKPESLSGLEPQSLVIPARGQAQLCVRVPSPIDNRHAETLEPDAFSRAMKEYAAHWTGILRQGMQITTPEPRVNNAWRAWLAWNFIDVDKKGDVYEPHDGAGFYEQVYGYSEILYCHALDLWGFHDDARRYLESMFHFQKPDGLFAINYGLPDHGGLLFALAQHYRITRDEAWLRSVAPRMVKMCDWVIERRKRDAARQGEQSPLTRGLIKFRPYADYVDETYNYYANAYCCIGLEHAAGALAAIGMTEPAQRITREAHHYRADILASMDAAVVERDGFKYLPMEPDTRRILESTQYKGGGYYGLIASMFLECDFLPANDPRARLVTNAFEQRDGLIVGMIEFDKGVDHAYTYGYWMNCLQRGEIDRVLLGFYGSLAYGMGQDTFCGVEVTHLLTGDPTPTMPHLYSGTQQLRLLRMMLLREEGDTLVIGQAIPRAWLEHGKRIEVRDAPTLFGKVSYVIESAVDDNHIDAHMTFDGSPAKEIRLPLRHPKGKSVSSIKVNGEEFAPIEKTVVIRGARERALRVRIAY